jgi:hypothetical protein
VKSTLKLTDDSNLRPMDYEGSDRLELFRAVDLLKRITLI